MQQTLRLTLKYGPHAGAFPITGIQRIRPSWPLAHFGREDVPGVGCPAGHRASTKSPQGRHDGPHAIKAGVGGEVPCNIWQGSTG